MNLRIMSGVNILLFIKEAFVNCHELDTNFFHKLNPRVHISLANRLPVSLHLDMDI